MAASVWCSLSTWLIGALCTCAHAPLSIALTRTHTHTHTHAFTFLSLFRATRLRNEMKARAERRAQLVKRVKAREYAECTFEPKITKRSQLLKEILEDN